MAILTCDKADLTDFQLRALDELDLCLAKHGITKVRVRKHKNKKEYWEHYGKADVSIEIPEYAIEIWIYHNHIGYESRHLEFGDFERLRGSTDDSILSEFFEKLEETILEEQAEKSI